MAETTLEASGRFWLAYLEQDEWWLPKEGPKVRIADMDPSWAGNAMRWLERRAGAVEIYYTHGELTVLGTDIPVVIGVLDGRDVEIRVPGASMLPSPGSMAELAFEDELAERGEDPAAWLATMPLHRALAARAEQDHG